MLTANSKPILSRNYKAKIKKQAILIPVFE